MKEHLLKRPEVVKNTEEMKKAWVNMQKTVDSEAKDKVRAFGYKGKIN